MFESQYIIPNGVSYNSYVILDEKVAVMDTVDARKAVEWFDNLTATLNGRNVNYLVVSHLEPGHSANIKLIAEKYPEAKIVLSAKAKAMLPHFFQIDNLDERTIIDKYQTRSSYQPGDDGVFVACASIHGNTKDAALSMVDILKEKGAKKVAFADLTRDDMAEAVEDTFRYDKIILAAATYDGGIFTPMDNFLHLLSHKAYQNRKVGLIENGSWKPTAAKNMTDILSTMKNIDICENKVTIKSVMNEANVEQMNILADEILK